MNQEEFEQLILSLNLTDNEKREEANARIRELQESDPQSFILMLIQVSQNERVTMAAITLLYAMCRHMQGIFDPEVTIQVLEHFLPASIEIFQNAEIAENTKLLTGTTISLMTIILHGHQPENAQVNEFLLQNIENEQITPFIIHTISEILYSSNDACNFDVEALTQLLEKGNTPLQRVKLYFAIASHLQEDNETIQGLFGPILEDISSSEDIPSCFRVISNFANEHSLFFRSTLEVLIDFIYERIFSSDDIAREGMYIIQNIAKAEPTMCKTCPEFITKSVDIFIRIISSVTEETCYDININDNTPSSIARSIVEPFFKNINSRGLFDILLSYIENIGETEDLAYGIIMAFANLPMTANYLDKVEELCEPFIQLFITEDLPDHLRYANFCALGHCAYLFCRKFHEIFYSQYIPAVFEQLGTCENENVLVEIIRFIRCYIEHIVGLSGDEMLFFLERIAEFIGATEDSHIIALLFDVLALLFEKANDRNIDLTDQIDLEAYMRCLDSEDEELVAKFILFFSYVLSRRNYVALKEGTNACFAKSIELIDSEDTSPQNAQILAVAQEKMMQFLGDDFAQYAERIIEEAISVIQSLPEGNEESIFEQFVTSGYYVINNSSPGNNCYIENSLIQTYQDAMTKLCFASQILGGSFSGFVERVIGYLSAILSQEMFIEPIHEYALNCIALIMCSQTSNTELYLGMLPTIIEIFKKELGTVFNDYTTMIKSFLEIIKTFVEVINKCPEQLESNAEMIISVFEPLAQLKATLERRSINLYENQESFDQVDESGTNFTHDLDVISLINDIYGHIGEILPEQTAGFIEENIIPSTMELVSNPLLVKEELYTITTFINITKSEDKLKEFPILFEILTETDDANAIYDAQDPEEDDEDDNNQLNKISDKMQTVLEGIIKLAMKIQFSPETARQIFDIAYDLYIDELMDCHIFDIPSDRLVVLLNLMIAKYDGIADEGTLIEIMKTCTGMHDENEYYYIVLNAICNYIRMFNDENYSTQDGVETIYALVCNFFSIFGQNHKTEYNKEIIRNFSILMSQHQGLKNIINGIIQRIKNKGYIENTRKLLGDGFNRFIAERNALIQAHQQQSQ